MTKKVTSYEISKRLDELNFQSDSHNGWWLDGGYQAHLRGVVPIPLEEIIKAYDCWDLLMWLQQYKRMRGEPIKSGEFLAGLDVYGDHFEWGEWSDTLAVSTEANQPQNALALAIIKILEEKK
jgi:hypothetical protein